MRKIKYIVVHCTATQPEAKIEDIKRYWKENLGWRNPGYHYILERDGTVTQLLPEEEIANGVKGFNESSVHMSYIGGVDRKNNPCDNRSQAQVHAIFDLIVELTERYPGAVVQGHRDFPGVAKACPSFDVKTWLKEYSPNLGNAA